jgi:acyl-CoA thioesterase FadM
VKVIIYVRVEEDNGHRLLAENETTVLAIPETLKVIPWPRAIAELVMAAIREGRQRHD